MSQKKRKRCRKCPACRQYIVVEGKFNVLSFVDHRTNRGEACKQVFAGYNK